MTTNTSKIIKVRSFSWLVFANSMVIKVAKDAKATFTIVFPVKNATSNFLGFTNNCLTLLVIFFLWIFKLK